MSFGRELDGRARVAAALWLVFAGLVWNDVFDRQVVNAGRAYIVAAVQASERSQDAVRIDDWMRPAINRAFWSATMVGVGFVAVAVLILAVAPRRPRRHATKRRNHDD